MTRIPPALSYLVIYNPTLQPSSGVAEDDEDAEAQAHILFYTSKEKAVSRDRMLRQVGLAKALVNFAELFSVRGPCDSVRSQARRMIMISPEPDFWIHAGVEIAKSIRLPPDKGKSKVKEKGKPLSMTSDDPTPAYEFHDESVQDEAIRSLLFRGYEQFKLIHGSLTQILSTLGQEALELQLERFFTVWAWSLNLEEIPDFGEHLGIPLHPTHRKIAKLLDSFEDGQCFSIFAQPPHVVPSTSYLTHGYPFALLRHIFTLVPRPRPTSEDLPSSGLENGVRLAEEAQQQEASLKNADNRKWHWPHYLTFSGKMKPNQNAGVLPETVEKPEDEPAFDKPQLSEVDESALEDAMSTITISALSQSANATPAKSVSDSRTKVESDNQTETPQSDDTDALAVSKPVPELQTTFVHLSEPTSPLLTARRPLHYFIDGQRLFIVVPLREDIFATGTELATKVATFFERLEEISEDDPLLSSADRLPSAAKILQPLDRHIVAREGLTLSDPLFSSQSYHLYETQAILSRDSEINEVFSRGQNPQHWHVARRGINVITDKPTSGHGEVYLEVFSKESSLTDVDNVLAGVIRK